MKYLHSGYILFCQRADYSDEGRINCEGLFDLFVVKELPAKMDCAIVIGFGTPYERRQYKGTIVIEDTEGQSVLSKEFNANDPNDIFKGHYLFRPDVTLNKEGMWMAKVTLQNWKDELVWDFDRKFWTMIEGDTPPDP